MEPPRAFGQREERDSQYYEPFDPAYAREMIETVFEPIQRHYFRSRLIGAQRIPKRGPVILVANHSGNAFPFDGMVLDELMWKRDGFAPEAKLRTVFDKELAFTWWMRPFGIDNFWRRCGGVDMTFDNFDRLLARGERVAYYPEGVPGIGKGFGRRYQLQPFKTSFVLLAARYGAPVIPVYIINAEWVIPFNYTIPAIDKLTRKLWHVPFLPLPGALIAITFPWAWYLALPARMVLVVGDPIDVPRMVREAGITRFDRPDHVRLLQVADRIRRQMQPRLDHYVRHYGRRPYHARLLWRKLREARRQKLLGQVLPTGWAPAFIRFDRDRRRVPARGRLHGMLRDWDLPAFYLPFGWPLLSLLRALRRPPYGYRGVSHSERQRQEGCFVWRLRERPLPPRGVAE